jgi:ABC-type Zn2+ transport system substrate-binding protein/surface adhesin
LGIILRTFLKATNSIARIVQKVNRVDGALPISQAKLFAVFVMDAELGIETAFAVRMLTCFEVVPEKLPTANRLPLAGDRIEAVPPEHVLAVSPEVVVEVIVFIFAEIDSVVSVDWL